MHIKQFVRASLALAAGLLLVAALPASASAGHPEGPPQEFFAEHDDTCTFTETAGELSWAATHPPEAPTVGVWGKALSATRGGCFYIAPVIAYIEFTAYTVDDDSDDADWEHAASEIDREVVPLEEGVATEFDLKLTPAAWIGIEPSPIDVVTVRACLTLRTSPPEDQAYDGQCGKADVHFP